MSFAKWNHEAGQFCLQLCLHQYTSQNMKEQISKPYSNITESILQPHGQTGKEGSRGGGGRGGGGGWSIPEGKRVGQRHSKAGS